MERNHVLKQNQAPLAVPFVRVTRETPPSAFLWTVMCVGPYACIRPTSSGCGWILGRSVLPTHPLVGVSWAIVFCRPRPGGYGWSLRKILRVAFGR